MAEEFNSPCHCKISQETPMDFLKKLPKHLQINWPTNSKGISKEIDNEMAKITVLAISKKKS